VPGDTFAIVANKLLISVNQIQELNPKVSPSNVYAGLKLVVPLPEMNYTVIQGETFASIALKFNTTADIIQELNPDKSPSNVYGGLVLKVPRPVGDFQILTKAQYEWQALLCTSQYETSTPYPRNFGVTAGNFDGAGVSWGAIQFNAKTGPLIAMWQAMINNHSTVTLNAFLENVNRTVESNTLNHDIWKAMMLRGDFAEILAWADSRSDEAKKDHGLIEPWNTYFMSLGITEEAQELQKNNASWYHQVALQWWNDFGLWSRQGYALTFDIAVQSGSMNPKVNSVTYDLIGEINTWYAGLDKTGKTAKQLEVEKLVKIANRRADYIDTSWQVQYRDRKVTLAEGYGVVNGLTMDTDGKYNLGLEPMYIDNVPSELWYPLEKVASVPPPPVDVGKIEIDSLKRDWGPKDFYNFEDLNRVEEATLVVKEKIGLFRGLSIDLDEVFTGRTEKTIEDAHSLNRIETNLERLKLSFPKPSIFDLSKTDWTHDKPFDFSDANRYERMLYDMYYNIENNISNIRYCGQVIAGEEGVF
jgi:LysM repeat protein